MSRPQAVQRSTRDKHDRTFAFTVRTVTASNRMTCLSEHRHQPQPTSAEVTHTGR